MTRNFDPMTGYNRGAEYYISAYKIPGQVVTEFPYRERSYSAEGALQNGNLLVRGTDTDQAQHPPALPADDPNAIKTNVASSTSAQTLGPSDFNGVIGAGKISPARAITFRATANAADFGAVDIIVKGWDASGNPISDVIHYDGTTLDTDFPTSMAFSGAFEVYFPAGTGATGTGEIGVSDAVVEYGYQDILGLCRYIPNKEPAETAGYDHDDTDRISSVYDGWVAATVEATAATAVVAGDPVYARVVTVGNDVRGQLTGRQAPGGNFARVLGATWEVAAAAGQNSVVRIWR